MVVLSDRHEKLTDRVVYEPDGRRRVYVDHFPDRILVSRELLENGDPRYLTFDGERLTFTYDNGRAIYQLVRWEKSNLDPDWDYCLMEAVEREWHRAE